MGWPTSNRRQCIFYCWFACHDDAICMYEYKRNFSFDAIALKLECVVVNLGAKAVSRKYDGIDGYTVSMWYQSKKVHAICAIVCVPACWIMLDIQLFGNNDTIVQATAVQRKVRTSESSVYRPIPLPNFTNSWRSTTQVKLFPFNSRFGIL